MKNSNELTKFSVQELSDFCNSLGGVDALCEEKEMLKPPGYLKKSFYLELLGIKVEKKSKTSQPKETHQPFVKFFQLLSKEDSFKKDSLKIKQKRLTKKDLWNSVKNDPTHKYYEIYEETIRQCKIRQREIKKTNNDINLAPKKPPTEFDLYKKDYVKSPEEKNMKFSEFSAYISKKWEKFQKTDDYEEKSEEWQFIIEQANHVYKPYSKWATKIKKQLKIDNPEMSVKERNNQAKLAWAQLDETKKKKILKN